MTFRTLLQRVLAEEHLNFLLTNALPRRRLTRAFYRFSRIEHPWVCRASLAVWKLFADVDLSDAREQHFRSLHHCFTRQLKPGTRPIAADARVLSSPCDGIVGGNGMISDGTAVQAKGQTYPLGLLLKDAMHAERYRGGCYVTLRLTAGMYHHFHAPYACRVRRVTHVPGDAFNVNPSTLKRIERLYCRNERAVIECELRPHGERIALVPVAAILVAGIRLPFLDPDRPLADQGERLIDCDAPLEKGAPMGWFEHGSTVILIAPRGFEPCASVHGGARVRMGEALLVRR
jgi:phosphatidylserine decarboxylase